MQPVVSTAFAFAQRICSPETSRKDAPSTLRQIRFPLRPTCFTSTLPLYAIKFCASICCLTITLLTNSPHISLPRATALCYPHSTIHKFPVVSSLYARAVTVRRLSVVSSFHVHTSILRAYDQYFGVLGRANL